MDGWHRRAIHINQIFHWNINLMTRGTWHGKLMFVRFSLVPWYEYTTGMFQVSDIIDNHFLVHCRRWIFCLINISNKAWIDPVRWHGGQLASSSARGWCVECLSHSPNRSNITWNSKLSRPLIQIDRTEGIRWQHYTQGIIRVDNYLSSMGKKSYW